MATLLSELGDHETFCADKRNYKCSKAPFENDFLLSLLFQIDCVLLVTTTATVIRVLCKCEQAEEHG